MPAPSQALLLLGGNIGDPVITLDAAEDMIRQEVGRVLARSRDHWTEPWGFIDARLFLNRALVIETEHEALPFMRTLLAIEHELGRKRGADRYEARAIDIDILLIQDLMMDTEDLTIPHPRMHERAFALEPAADVAPDWTHPKLNRTVLEMLNDLRGAA